MYARVAGVGKGRVLVGWVRVLEGKVVFLVTIGVCQMAIQEQSSRKEGGVLKAR